METEKRRGDAVYSQIALILGKHRTRKPKVIMLELCFFTRLLFLSEPLVSALLAELSDEWETGKIYLNMECPTQPSV